MINELIFSYSWKNFQILLKKFTKIKNINIGDKSEKNKTTTLNKEEYNYKFDKYIEFSIYNILILLFLLIIHNY